MCYDVSFTVNIRSIADYFPDLIFDGQIDMELFPMDHIQGSAVFPKQPIIYVNKEDQKRHLRMMEWGAIPFYQKNEPTIVQRNNWLNARAERVLTDKNSYWYKIRNKRCLVPVTGIFEHRAIAGWKKKVPYWIKPKDQELFFLPGLYSVANIPDKETGEIIERWTYVFFTRAANSVMRMIHNSGDNPYRMPLFLTFEMAKEFLSMDLTDDRYAEILAYEMPSEDLYYHPTDTIRTPKPRKDGKRKYELYEWEGMLPELGTFDPV